MRVIRANAAGACFGVQRALDLANQAANDFSNVRSFGPLIHNPQVVAQLADKGVAPVESVGDDFNGAIVIRSHGIGPSERETLNRPGIDIIDATCPHVLRAQQAAIKLARAYGAVIVVGDPHHPEVNAIIEYAEQAGGRIWAVDSPEHIPANLPAKVGVVVQTTQNRELFSRILAALADTGVETDVKDTICSATAQRQSAASELAKQVDAMVVIGGHNSSNTTRLYEICKAICPKTYHIEAVSELNSVDFASCETIGITAGASTPESQIVPVEEYLERL